MGRAPCRAAPADGGIGQCRGRPAGGPPLIAGGRQRLLFVGYPAPPEFADRLDGFRQGARSTGLAVQVLATAMMPGDVHAALAVRLATGPVPDGIFAASDVVALAALRTLAEAGIEVPRGAAVIGYDDVTLAAHISPCGRIRTNSGRG